MTIRGTRHRLGPEPDAAELKFHKPLTAEPEQQGADLQPVVMVRGTLLHEANIRSAQIPGSYQKYCRSFVDFLESGGLRGLRIKKFTPLYVNRRLNSFCCGKA